jgi:hypothetical protein
MIRGNQNKGDFLALIGRRCEADKILLDTFARHFDQLSNKQFRLQPFELTTLPIDRWRRSRYNGIF